MAYPLVKMKGETMSDHKPLISLRNLGSKDIALTVPAYRRTMLILPAGDRTLPEKVR